MVVKCTLRRLRPLFAKCAAMASTSAGIVYCVGMIVDVDAELRGRLGGDRPDRRHDGGSQQIGGLLGAEDLREIPHRRGAGERHDVDAPSSSMR